MLLVTSIILAWCSIIALIPETSLGMHFDITYFSARQLLLFIPAIVTTVLAYHHVVIKELKQQVAELAKKLNNSESSESDFHSD